MNDPIDKNLWWAYLHSNGTIQIKRWFGDHADYTTDCDGNSFVQQVVSPFFAINREEAFKVAVEKLQLKRSSEAPSN